MRASSSERNDDYKKRPKIMNKNVSTFEKLNEISRDDLSDMIFQNILYISTLDSTSSTDHNLLQDCNRKEGGHDNNNDNKSSKNKNDNCSNILILFLKQIFEFGVTSPFSVDESGDHNSVRSRSHLNSNRLFPSYLLHDKNNSCMNKKYRKNNTKFNNMDSFSGSKLLKLLPNLGSILYPLSLGALAIEISPSTTISSLDKLIKYALNYNDRIVEKGQINDINHEMSNSDHEISDITQEVQNFDHEVPRENSCIDTVENHKIAVTADATEGGNEIDDSKIDNNNSSDGKINIDDDNGNHLHEAAKLIEHNKVIQTSHENSQKTKKLLEDNDLIDIKMFLKIIVEECLLSLETASRMSSQNAHLADIDWLHSNPVGAALERGGPVGVSSEVGMDPSLTGPTGIGGLLGKNTLEGYNPLGKADRAIDIDGNRTGMKPPFNIIWAFNTLHLLLLDKKYNIGIESTQSKKVYEELASKNDNENGIGNENKISVDANTSQNILSRLFNISSGTNVSLRLCSYELIALLLFSMNTSNRGINTQSTFHPIEERKLDEKNYEKKNTIKKNETDLIKTSDVCISHENEKKMVELYSTCLRNEMIDKFLPSHQFCRYMRSVGSALLQWSILKKKRGFYSNDIYEAVIHEWVITDKDTNDFDADGSDDELDNHGYGGFKMSPNSNNNVSSNHKKPSKLFISQLSSGSITVSWEDVPVKISETQKSSDDLLIIDNKDDNRLSNDSSKDVNKTKDRSIKSIQSNLGTIGLYIAMKSHTGDLDRYLLLLPNLLTPAGTYRIDGLQSDTLYKVTAASSALLRNIETEDQKEEGEKEEEDEDENKNETNADISLYVTTETEKLFSISDKTSSPNLILGRTKSSQTMRNCTSKKWSTARYIFIYIWIDGYIYTNIYIYMHV
jgi:hypothetical protein